MDQHIDEFFSQSNGETSRGHFHKVIPLNTLSWQEASEIVPNMSKGWHELMQLTSADRIEFVHDHWLAKLPYHKNLAPFLEKFFDSLDDITILLTQKLYEDPFEAQMIYSIKDNGGFFKALPPASEEEIIDLEKGFVPTILPEDYLLFLKVHNGFSKATDCTGMMPANKMPAFCQTFQNSLEEPLQTSRGKLVDPKTLFPFYESFGMPFFQCFWSEWYPENEMGNVYYSGTTKSIIDVNSNDPSSESMAFPTFLDWLMFYMERVD